MENKNTHPDEHSEFESFVNKRMNMQEDEQNFEAGQLIDRIAEIDTDKAYNFVYQRISMPAHRIGWLYHLTKYAAILTIPLLCALLYSLYLNVKTKKQEFVTYELICPTGIRTNATLPDGTKVWLNSESSIQYELPFVGNERRIKLTGEAFFDVIKNPKSPFIINSQNTFIKVLGTKFNVKSYPSEEEIDVTLEEGSVNFGSTGINNNYIQTILKNNDYLVFKKKDKSLSVINGNIKKFTSWRYNRLILDETPIQQLAVLLERWYDVKVEIVDPELLNYKFSTTFDNEPLNRVLELLEISSPIRIKYVPAKKITGTDKSQSAKVFIYKK